ILPQPVTDTADQEVRLTKYGDVSVSSVVRKQHALADEGTYFITNNAQTGIATPTATTFAATTPMVIISNTDSAGNGQNAKRIYLDYIDLVTTAAGSFASGGVNLQTAVVIDNSLRYSSGGTDITANIVSPNMDVAKRTSVATVQFGSLTA